MKARTRINSEDFPCWGSKKTEKIYFFRDFGRRLKMALETLANRKKTNLIEKHCFPQFSTRISWNRSLAAFDLFYMTTQLIKFYTPDCHILKSTDVWTRRLRLTTQLYHTKLPCQKPMLTILTGKNLCFTKFNTKTHWNTRLAPSDVFHMFTKSIKFFWFHYRTDVWKTWLIK